MSEIGRIIAASHCGHGKSLKEDCPACVKMLSMEERLAQRLSDLEETLALLARYADQHAKACLARAHEATQGTFTKGLHAGRTDTYVGIVKLLKQPDRLRILRLETTPAAATAEHDS